MSKKIILDNLFAILNKIGEVEYYKELKTQLKPLKTVYDEVRISYIYHEPKMVEKNGELFVEDNTESIVEISKDHVKKIGIEVENIRRTLFIK